LFCGRKEKEIDRSSVCNYANLFIYFFEKKKEQEKSMEIDLMLVANLD
jgi:hypothetical protein